MNLFDTRFNQEKGYYEILTAVGDFVGGQLWEPVGTLYVKNRIAYSHDNELRHYSLLELLLMEGWKPPEVES